MPETPISRGFAGMPNFAVLGRGKNSDFPETRINRAKHKVALLKQLLVLCV